MTLNPAPPLVELSAVSKRFGRGAPALDDISGEVRGGEITGLVGPDGAGKTTLIRLLAGLLLADTGTLRVLGHDPATDPASIHANIGYMPQRFGLYEDLSVQENLDLYADLRGLPRAERAAVFGQLMDLTDLGGFRGRLAGKLSGGMKQKLGLACALLRKPRLLLLDEPSVGVDPISRRELWALVQRLAGEGIGVLWSTAYLDEAEACARVLLLSQGKLLFSGDPAQLSRRVDGRVYTLSGVQGRRRGVLMRALEQPGVIDGVAQGGAIRLLMAAGAGPPSPPRADQGASVSTTLPRFEDAFVDLLGGGPGGRSALAEAMPPLAERPGMVIEADGLTKRFGDFLAADGISFEIPRGQIFGLLGPNGAGKSTTFKLLCGLLKPTAGVGRVAGFDLRRQGAEARRQLGYMAQKFSLYGDLSLAQNLEFFAGAYGLSGARRRQRIELMIEVFDFARQLRSPAGELPLGFKQRLALACAVMHEPRALFLDEPTSGVDPIARREFWTHINGLVEKGVSVLVTTHFMEEAEYCDRIALIFRGRSIALGSPDELKAAAATAAIPQPSMEEAFIALVQASDTPEPA